MPHKVGNGAILGIVSEDGVPAQKRITLMDRSDLSIVQRSVSDEYGAYAFTGLNPDTDDYLLFTVDDDGVEKKAAIIYDYVKPIPAHQGGFYWSNWYRLSMMKEPIVSIIPIAAGVGSNSNDLPYGVGRSPTVFFGFNTQTNQPSITPAAGNIPSVSFDASGYRKMSLNNQGLLNSGSKSEVSFEWVLDLRKPLSSKVSLLFFLTKAEGTVGTGYYREFYYKSGIFSVDYNNATGVISLRRDIANGAPPAQDAVLDNVMVNAINYTVPESLKNSVLHISGSIAYGDSASLYVNGVTVKTVSLTGTSQSYNRFSASQVGILTVGSSALSSYYVDTNPATLTCSIAAVYAETMTEEESLALYNALMVDSIPAVTGYLKSVIEDYPLYLYRLQEPIETNFAIDALRPNHKDGNPSILKKGVYSGITHSYESMVIGGSGKVFNGGGYVEHNLFAAPSSKSQLTVEFIAKPSVGASGVQVILSQRREQKVYFEVRLNQTTMKPTLVWLELDVVVSINFNTAFSTTAMQHYAFSVDKTTSTASLIVNGVIVETVVTSNTVFDVPRMSSIDVESIYIGGILASNLSSISNPYYGYLSEVALYPVALSQATIKKHYDARLTL